MFSKHFFYCKIKKAIMRRLFIILFFMVLWFSTFSQALTDTSSQKVGDPHKQTNHLKNTDSLTKKRNTKKINSSDSSSGNLKSKISKVYKKLDKSPLTHKYIKQINDLGGKVSNKYKNIDSIARADTGIARVIALKQNIAKSLKSRKEVRDSVNNYKLNLSNTSKKEDTIASIHLPADFKIIEKQNPQEARAADFVNSGYLYLHSTKTKEAILDFEKGLHLAQEEHS